MRLICPNCGAQYEVDDAVIPEQGRDVQCSNCGHTWFQQPAHLDGELADELGEDTSFDTSDLKEQLEDGEQPERRGLDPDVANVLREEAQRETAARKADADGLETQPGLGLDDGADEAAEMAANRSAAARARMARLRGIDESSSEGEAAGIAATVGSRKELLPDVEEINSSLRASQDHDDDQPDPVAQEEEHSETGKKGGGSRLLSRLIILVVVVGLLVYVFAPQIIEAVPQSEPHLVAYVEWANGVRSQLNALIDTAVTRAKDLIGSFTGG